MFGLVPVGAARLLGVRDMITAAKRPGLPVLGALQFGELLFERGNACFHFANPSVALAAAGTVGASLLFGGRRTASRERRDLLGLPVSQRVLTSKHDRRPKSKSNFSRPRAFDAISGTVIMYDAIRGSRPSPPESGP